jgi:hypothetical protein
MKITTIQIGEMTGMITNNYIFDLQRKTCANFGRKATFGYRPTGIGNKSIGSDLHSTPSPGMDQSHHEPEHEQNRLLPRPLFP